MYLVYELYFRKIFEDMKCIIFFKLFFKYLGMQNDYLYPFEGQINVDVCPFKKSHWYKTRVGFNTAWLLAKLVSGI